MANRALKASGTCLQSDAERGRNAREVPQGPLIMSTSHTRDSGTHPSLPTKAIDLNERKSEEKGKAGEPAQDGRHAVDL